MTTFTVAELQSRVQAIFLRAGFAADHAAALARVITAGERDGCTSHGVYRIAGILRTLKAGKVNPDARPVVHPGDGAIIHVNADGGVSSTAFDLGLPHLVTRAERLGLAALVINDCSHFSALWPEAEAIAARGLVALVMCPSYATVAPAGGSRPLLGTNPIAFGWPRGGQAPYVFDFATSVAARGEIELHRRRAEPIPEGWALGPDGSPTTDPVAALAGAMLPFGGHKGSAISTMIELLAGAMIGDFTSAEALAFLGTTSLIPRHGELVLAFSPAKFNLDPQENPLQAAETLFAAIAGQGARLPSARRYAARNAALRDGITLAPAVLEDLDRFAALGLDAVSTDGERER